MHSVNLYHSQQHKREAEEDDSEGEGLAVVVCHLLGLPAGPTQATAATAAEAAARDEEGKAQEATENGHCQDGRPPISKLGYGWGQRSALIKCRNTL